MAKARVSGSAAKGKRSTLPKPKGKRATAKKDDDRPMAYCVKEREKHPMDDKKAVTTKNGRKAYKGVCSSCGTKMFMMRPKDG